MQVADRETDLEQLNRKALKLARQVADETGTLMAGNICNTTIWKTDDKESHDVVRSIFKVKFFISFLSGNLSLMYSQWFYVAANQNSFFLRERQIFKWQLPYPGSDFHKQSLHVIIFAHFFALMVNQ